MMEVSRPPEYASTTCEVDEDDEWIERSGRGTSAPCSGGAAERK
jgi:hypothetical protein